MQLVLAPDVIADGLQEIPESASVVEVGEIETVVALLTPLQAAATLTEVTVVTVPAFEVKLAVVEPAGTIRLEGTGRDADDDVMVTVALACGALLRVTAQVSFAPDAIDDGLHEMPDRVGTAEAGEIETIVDLLMPFRPAVTLTKTFEDTVPPVAANLVVEKPAGTFTVDGTAKTSLEEESLTTADFVTFALRLTVQVMEAPDAVGLGEQAMLESVGSAAAGEIESVADLLTPLKVAVTLTEVTAETVPAVEPKLADVEPAGTITLAGTGRDADDELRLTVALV